MERQQDQQQSDPMVAAIEHVLKTERDGMQQLQRSQEQAQHLLSQARAQAGAIARRADVCISKLHNAYLQKVQRNIERLPRANLSSGEPTGNAHGREMLAQAARRVAAKLTGGT